MSSILESYLIIIKSCITPHTQRSHPPPEDCWQWTRGVGVPLPLTQGLGHLVTHGVIELCTQRLVCYHDNVVAGKLKGGDVLPSGYSTIHLKIKQSRNVVTKLLWAGSRVNRASFGPAFAGSARPLPALMYH